MHRDSSGRNHMRADRQSNWDCRAAELAAGPLGARWCSRSADRDSRLGGKASLSQARSAIGPGFAFFRRRPCGGLAYERRRRSNGFRAAQAFLASWPSRYRDTTRSGGDASFAIIGTLVDRTWSPMCQGQTDCDSALGRTCADRRLPLGRPAAAAGAEPSRPARLRPRLGLPREVAAGLQLTSSRAGRVALAASIYRTSSPRFFPRARAPLNGRGRPRRAVRLRRN